MQIQSNNKIVDIIIVNWNSGLYLYQCLRSILISIKNTVCIDQVCIVDNDSKDNSLSQIETVDLPLNIIKNSSNKGFATACNIGAKDSKSDYLLFLNPDTRLFDNSLEESIKFMEHPDNSNVGVCGIQLIDESGMVSRSCSRLLSLPILVTQAIGLNKIFPKFFLSQFMEEWDHGNTQDVEEVIGAFFLVRREVFELLGGFDERFFVYSEEVDFCYRLRENGWRVSYLAEAQAFHKGGGSSENVKAHRLFYHLRSRILYVHKHFGWFSKFIAIAVTIILEPISRISFALIKLSPSLVSETIAGYLMLYKWCLKQVLTSNIK
jgi:N-acetylglucosaminyl-diphospho-decaprenol L-rhamnosyltransferase